MLTVTPVPALSDNYIWVLQRAGGAVAVDPGEAEPLLAKLAYQQLQLRAVLITHHHGDHTGALRELIARHPGLPVFGPATVRGVNHPVADGEHCEVLGEIFQVIAVPGHTLDHLAFYGAGHLFCGDTLFGAGCGRLFEGSPAQMHASLQKLAALPAATLVCPAHEYTLSNLAFALAADPANPALLSRRERDQAKRRAGNPTLPSTLAEERQSNPFLRCDQPALAAAAARFSGQAELSDPVQVFAALRRWKNEF